MTSAALKKPRVIWEPHKGSQELALCCPANIILYHGTRGPGKRLDDNEKVLTDTGWKLVKHVTYSDKLVALDGSYTNIIGIYPCEDRPIYNVEFHDGAVVKADAEHRWLTLNSKTGYREGWKVRTTEQLLKTKVPMSVPYLQGAVGGKQWQGLDPYAVGYIISNGTTLSKDLTVYSIDDEVLNYFRDRHGWAVYEYDTQTARRAVCLKKAESDEWKSFIGFKKGPEKYIPEELMQADAATRLALLQGLMDGDGNYEKGAQTRYSTASSVLAEQVVQLVKSLGGWAGIATSRNKPEHDTFGANTLMYRINISHHNHFMPFRLKRKAERVQEQKKFLTRGIKSITYSHNGPGRCFAVDHKDHCFVCGDWVITHNTDTQLMRFRKNVGIGYGRFWRGVIFDREYKNLDDLVSKSIRWFPEFYDGARFLSAKSDYKWVWPTGEELLFRVVKKEKDYWMYHGQEFPFIGWNELTKYPDAKLFDSMMSCNRSSFIPNQHPVLIDGDIYDKTGQVIFLNKKRPGAREWFLPDIPLEVFATTNPFGAGHNWVKRKFIDKSPMGGIKRDSIVVFNPRVQKKEEVVVTQCHIFGSYRENKNLDPKYIAQLVSITDPNKRKAWLGGSWDVTSGGMFDDIWEDNVHLVAPFPIPASWTIFRSFDWGSSKPFSVGWHARSDGTEIVYPDGRRFRTIKGDLFRINEWYGCEKDEKGEPEENVGLRMLAVDIAAGIIQREREMGYYGVVKPGPADNSIWDTQNGNSIAADLEKPVKIAGRQFSGVFFSRSDKSAGSRVWGWEKIRLYLSNAKVKNGQPREFPGYFVFNTCADTIRLFPSLPRDEEKLDDVDTDAEDHIGDEIRYVVLGESIGIKTGTTKGQ